MPVVAEEVLQGVKDQIVGLSLDGITTNHVVVMSMGDDQSGDGPEIPGYPCLVIWIGNPETIEEATNISDDVTYPVALHIISAEKSNEPTLREKVLGWRQAIRGVFSGKRLPGVTGGYAWKCQVRPGTVLDRPKWMQGYWATTLVIGVTVREGTRA